MDDFRAILRENALGETPEVDKAHSTFVGLRDFDKQGLNIILHVRTPPSPFPCTCTPPPSPFPRPFWASHVLHDRTSSTGMQVACSSAAVGSCIRMATP